MFFRFNIFNPVKTGYFHFFFTLALYNLKITDVIFLIFVIAVELI